MAPANPLVRAAAEAEAARFALAAADDFARFFAGDLAELQMRWGLTAVEFNDGQWGVVAPGEPMRDSDRAVLVYQGGTFAGRKYYRGAEFFKTDVKNVYFAALTLSTGEAGAAALRSVGGDGGDVDVRVVVEPASSATAGNKWATRLRRGEGEVESTLSDALAAARLPPVSTAAWRPVHKRRHA